MDFKEFVRDYRARNDYKNMLWEKKKAEFLHYMKNSFGGAALMEGALFAKVCRNGKWFDLGCVGKKSVTTAFCEFMVDQLIAEGSTWGDFKWHQLGTGATAENIAHTALVTPVEAVTAGTQVEGSSVIYQSVADIAITATRILREHGIFNTNAPGTMLDRTMFDIVTLYNGDTYNATYKLSCVAGG